MAGCLFGSYNVCLYLRSLVAAVELIHNNAKDLGELQRKVDNWHAQGLDDREITLRAKDEQLKSKSSTILSFLKISYTYVTLRLLPYLGQFYVSY